MTSASSQKGLSLFGWLLALALVAFVASTAMKVVPHYLDYMSMKKIINAVGTDKSLEISTVSEFFNHVSKGMQVNSIRDVDLNKALSVTVENNKFLAHLKYEEREPLIENIDLVVRFDHEFSMEIP